MRCTSPRTVGFYDDGKTICWSPKHYSKQYATFQLPCGKCIECRLEYARQWAVRCVHESKMYDDNSFVTLTYSDEHLTSQRLNYRDFQLFLMRLRSHVRADVRKSIGKANWTKLSDTAKKEAYDSRTIGVFVTGEYGDKTKRPHWHAILFNWRPSDSKLKYTSPLGDKVYQSDTLDKLWGKGICEFGSVTFESAGYCARYAAKKLSHGKDSDHDFHPISKKSSKHAIGKKFLEKFWPDIFTHGHVILPDGSTCSIPRYYEKWFKKHHPERWQHYVTKTKQNKIEKASEKRDAETLEYNLASRSRGLKRPLITRNESRKRIQASKFKQLQQRLKL